MGEKEWDWASYKLKNRSKTKKGCGYGVLIPIDSNTVSAYVVAVLDDRSDD